MSWPWVSRARLEEERGRHAEQLAAEHQRLLECERGRREDREAWAQAHAKERAELLRHAAEERAALINGLLAVQQPAAYVAPPWEGPRKLTITEADEIEADRQGIGVEDYVAGIDRELAERGFAGDGSEIPA